jgi:hypothetical protein
VRYPSTRQLCDKLLRLGPYLNLECKMALVVVIVASGGIPVREVSGTSAYGLPVVIAANGRGVPVTIVTSGGIPVVGESAVGC